MMVVSPIKVTDAVLLSSSVAESEAAPYAPGTAYALNALCIYLHRVYRSLQPGNTGHTPGATGNEAWWEDKGPTNRWAMLGDDPSVSTSAADAITVRLAPGMVRALCLPDVDAGAVQARMYFGAEKVFDSGAIDLRDERHVVDAYSYFFGKFRSRTTVLLTDLPPYAAGEIELAISRPGGTVRCAPLVVGELDAYGEDEFGVSVGIKDYSYVNFTSTGKGTLNKRGFAKTMDVPMVLERDEVDRAFIGIAALRATPALYIIGGGQYDCLVAYGIASFRISIPNAKKSRCTLSLQGLTQ